MSWVRSLALAAVVLGAWSSSSCAPGGFQDATVVDSVRILASSAEPPYAAPGATVRVRVLAVDGRAAQPVPMVFTWVPFVCLNPPNDAYYACFGPGAGSDGGPEPDAGTGAGEGALTSCDGGDNCVEFTMPVHAIESRVGVPIDYGLVILFNAACAGQLRPAPLDPNNVQSLPFGCFDAQNNPLDPSDYVLGFARVYAYDPAVDTNANPVIDSVDVVGAADVDAGGGCAGNVAAVDTQRTATEGLTAPIVMYHQGSPCSQTIQIGPVVPASSQEPNPAQHDVNGNELNEQVWAEFFSTFGSFKSGARLLYAPTPIGTNGSVGDTSATDNQFTPPSDPGGGFIWIVVHDNRGGANWVTVPVLVL